MSKDFLRSNKETVEWVWVEFGQNERSIKEAVDVIKEWLKSQVHLPNVDGKDCPLKQIFLLLQYFLSFWSTSLPINLKLMMLLIKNLLPIYSFFQLHPNTECEPRYLLLSFEQSWWVYFPYSRISWAINGRLLKTCPFVTALKSTHQFWFIRDWFLLRKYNFTCCLSWFENFVPQPNGWSQIKGASKRSSIYCQVREMLQSTGGHCMTRNFDIYVILLKLWRKSFCKSREISFFYELRKIISVFRTCRHWNPPKSQMSTIHSLKPQRLVSILSFHLLIDSQVVSFLQSLRLKCFVRVFPPKRMLHVHPSHDPWSS